MALPTQNELRQPVFEIIQQNQGISLKEIYPRIAKMFNLTDEEMAVKVSNGSLKYHNTVQWVIQKLKDNNLIHATGWGVYEALDNLEGVSIKEVKLFSTTGEDPSEEEMSLDIFAEDYYQSVEEEILSRLKNVGENSADKGRFFEEKCLELLEKMGYGKGERTGGSGDRGIDGFLIRDPLGFERIGIQCKCYTDGKVDDNEITKFAHGLKNVHGCTQGVFLTTSDFLPRAKKAAEETKDIKIILIHGIKLAELMRKYQVGVKIKETKYIYDIDL